MIYTFCKAKSPKYFQANSEQQAKTTSVVLCHSEPAEEISRQIKQWGQYAKFNPPTGDTRAYINSKYSSQFLAEGDVAKTANMSKGFTPHVLNPEQPITPDNPIIFTRADDKELAELQQEIQIFHNEKISIEEIHDILRRKAGFDVQHKPKEIAEKQYLETLDSKSTDFIIRFEAPQTFDFAESGVKLLMKPKIQVFDYDHFPKLYEGGVDVQQFVSFAVPASASAVAQGGTLKQEQKQNLKDKYKSLFLLKLEAAAANEGGCVFTFPNIYFRALEEQEQVKARTICTEAAIEALNEFSAKPDAEHLGCVFLQPGFPKNAASNMGKFAGEIQKLKIPVIMTDGMDAAFPSKLPKLQQTSRSVMAALDSPFANKFLGCNESTRLATEESIGRAFPTAMLIAGLQNNSNLDNLEFLKSKVKPMEQSHSAAAAAHFPEQLPILVYQEETSSNGDITFLRIKGEENASAIAKSLLEIGIISQRTGEAKDVWESQNVKLSKGSSELGYILLTREDMKKFESGLDEFMSQKGFTKSKEDLKTTPATAIISLDSVSLGSNPAAQRS